MKRVKKILGKVLVKLVIFALLVLTFSRFVGTDSPKASAEECMATIVRVVDGDTFVIRRKDSKQEEKLRLIGVDTPESVHSDKTRNTKWGKKASQYSKKKLTGKTVKLEFDKQKTDVYGRTLAYLYVKEKGKYVMYNKTLVSKGYARAVCYEPNHKYKKTFNKLQKTAKKKKLGFWKVGYTKAFPT